ncbi:MAG: hypothetical protein IPG44_17455 [Anaerolineales bacterium]|nr:hypothetical protein [Anaerolineales bacterium]
MTLPKNPIAIGFGSPGTQGYLPMLEEALRLANAQAVLTLPENGMEK